MDADDDLAPPPRRPKKVDEPQVAESGKTFYKKGPASKYKVTKPSGGPVDPAILGVARSICGTRVKVERIPAAAAGSSRTQAREEGTYNSIALLYVSLDLNFLS